MHGLTKKIKKGSDTNYLFHTIYLSLIVVVMLCDNNHTKK